MYEKPKLERVGTLRELTRSGAAKPEWDNDGGDVFGGEFVGELVPPDKIICPVCDGSGHGDFNPGDGAQPYHRYNPIGQ